MLFAITIWVRCFRWSFKKTTNTYHNPYPEYLFSNEKKVCFITAWKVSKYWVFSGQYFPVFELHRRKYEPEKTPYWNGFHAVYLIRYRAHQKEKLESFFSLYYTCWTNLHFRYSWFLPNFSQAAFEV